MLFNSLRFLFFFLPVTMLGFHLLGRFGRRPVILWLAGMSVLFYAAWSPALVLFLLASVAVNYLLSVWLAHACKPSRQPPASGKPRLGRNGILWLGLAFNLAALLYFKYLYKALLLLHAHGWLTAQPHPMLLPLGISFFTFTQISYLVDLAQGQAERQDFPSYLLFVTFFPHLIAGPILHHKEMMPQFARGNKIDPSRPLSGATIFGLLPADVSIGLTWFLLGLAKKVLIADKLAPAADAAFAHPATLSAPSAWIGIVVYSMQLYFDFSGYSDMAMGLARIFSIRFPLNFDSPYKATSITEYWQRWHITLTRYITLYVYNPLLLRVQRKRLAQSLKISRKALATFNGFITMVAYPTMITMLLTGIWHGAGLQFLLFGGIHGVYLTLNQAWRHFRSRSHQAPALGVPRFAMMVGVYLQVCFALIFFRASSLHGAFTFLSALAGLHPSSLQPDISAGAWAFALFPVVWFFPNTQQILGQETRRDGIATSPGTPAVNPTPAPSILTHLRWKPDLLWATALAILFFAVLVSLDSTSTFLYFQF